MERWADEIFVDNIIIGFSSHKFWTASTSKTNTININFDQTILNFLMLYNKELWYVCQIRLNLIVYVNDLTYFV